MTFRGRRSKAVELVDLHWQSKKVRREVRSAWSEIMKSSGFILGSHVSEFEKEFASFSGVDHVVGVGNGTDAIELALRALGVGVGDEVIIPVNSFVASAVAVSRCGATPVFVDCIPETWLLDIGEIESKVSDRTRAILPVHLYGQMADMKRVLEVAARHGLYVVEDMAQAHGATQHGRAAGSFGDAAATSFYPGKNLGAMGDAGAVLTNNLPVRDAVLSLRNYGSSIKYSHPEVGFNSRLDSFQAAVLSAKLRRLAEWNEMRNEQANFYLEEMSGLPEVKLPVTVDGNSHVWHLFPVLTNKRDLVAESMASSGVKTGIHYPKPIHLLGAYEDKFQRKNQNFPVAEKAAKMLLSLPIYPGLTRRMQRRVVHALKQALVEYDVPVL